MKILAGVADCDIKIANELKLAGIPAITVQKSSGEVPYTLVGQIGNWTFTRLWYYWSATNKVDGLPLATAEILHYTPYPKSSHEIYGDVIRVAGHGGAPSPTEWAFPDMDDVQIQMTKLGIKDGTYGNIAKLLNEGILTGDRYVKTYHIDTQEGLNEFARTLNPETIVCAAIHFDDGIPHEQQPKNIETGIVVCGINHSQCNAIAGALQPSYDYKKGKTTQGFLTNLNRFVNRDEGFQIALLSSQIETGKTQKSDKLYSEDIFK